MWEVTALISFFDIILNLVIVAFCLASWIQLKSVLILPLYVHMENIFFKKRRKSTFKNIHVHVDLALH